MLPLKNNLGKEYNIFQRILRLLPKNSPGNQWRSTKQCWRGTVSKLHISAQSLLFDDNYTYMNESWGTESWPNHVVPGKNVFNA